MGFQPEICVLKKWRICYAVITLYLALSTSFSEGIQGQCSFNKLTGFVNCRNKNLTSVPSNLPPDAKIVDLSENNIQQLEKTAFKSSSFITELYLAKNNISAVNYGLFGNLKGLKLLDVSDNHLLNFHVDLPVSLEILYLDGNPLSNDYTIFQQRLLFIKYLSLARTQLTNPSVFASFLPVLQFLDLRDIPSLTLTTEDLKKLQQLRILYVSPRMFSGRTKSQKCREFIQAAKESKIEVKAFSCFPEELFEIKSRAFERVYQVNDAMNDYPDNILNDDADKIEASLHHLQTLVSNGMTNFVKSLLVERRQKQEPVFKVKEPLMLENFFVQNPQIGLFNVNMTGYTILNLEKKPTLSISSSDAEEIKRFKIEYQTAESKRDITIAGYFNVYDASGTFSCRFTNTNFETVRQMLRRYDLRLWPTHIKEKLEFEKMDCTTSSSNNHVDKVIDMVLTAMSSTWLGSVSTVVNSAIVDPSIFDMSRVFSNMYRERVLRKLIDDGIEYLKSLNVSSFDVSPSLYSSNDTAGIELDFSTNVYNIKIENLYNYSNNLLGYSEAEGEHKTLKILGWYVVNYNPESAAMLIISAKDNPTDLMIIAVNKIEFKIEYEVKSVNKVMKLSVADVSVKIVEKDAQRTSFVFSLLKNYLGIELAKEFKRSLVFLMDKIDFYSLNVD